MRNRGFTLIEVLVALAIAGLVVLLAHRVFAAVADGGRRLVAAREASDRDANARRWLKATLLSLDVGDAAGPFEGRPNRVRFSAWQMTAGGWFERREIGLGETGGRFEALLRNGERGAVRDGEAITLADSVIEIAFDYLLEPGADTKWVREWISPVSAPLAIRFRIAMERRTRVGGRVDTLLFLIKERG